MDSFHRKKSRGRDCDGRHGSGTRLGILELFDEGEFLLFHQRDLKNCAPEHSAPGNDDSHDKATTLETSQRFASALHLRNGAAFSVRHTESCAALRVLKIWFPKRSWPTSAFLVQLASLVSDVHVDVRPETRVRKREESVPECMTTLDRLKRDDARNKVSCRMLEAHCSKRSSSRVPTAVMMAVMVAVFEGDICRRYRVLSNKGIMRILSKVDATRVVAKRFQLTAGP